MSKVEQFRNRVQVNLEKQAAALTDADLVTQMIDDYQNGGGYDNLEANLEELKRRGFGLAEEALYHCHSPNGSLSALWGLLGQIAESVGVDRVVEFVAYGSRKTADQFSADASECSKCGAAISFDPDTNKWADEDNGSTTCAEGGKHSPTSPDEHRDWELIGAKRKQGATLDKGPRTFVPEQLKDQLAFWDVAAISGGRIETHGNGFRLPVAYGYAVDIFLEADDTYTVQTVFTRSGVTKVVNSSEGVYADEVSQAAYQASLFRDKPWEKGGSRKQGLTKSDICPNCGAWMDDVSISDDVLRAVCDSCGWRGSKRKRSAKVGAPIGDWNFDEHVQIIDATPRTSDEYVCGACGLSESEIGGEKDDGSCAHVALSRHEDISGQASRKVAYDPEMAQLGDMFQHQFEDMKGKERADTLPCPEHKDKEATHEGTYASFPSSYSEYRCPEGHDFKVKVGTTREDILAEGKRTAVLQIRQKNYRGQEGWVISGKVSPDDAFAASVFVPGPRSNAEIVKANLIANKDNVFEGITTSGSKKTGFLNALQRGVRRVLALDPQSGYGDSSLPDVEEDTPDDDPMWPWEIGEIVEEVVEEVTEKESSLTHVWAYNGLDPFEACEICGQPLAKVGGSYQHLSGMADIDHRPTPRFARVALEDTNTDETMWEVELPGDSEDPASGEDAADVGDVPTPGQLVDDYPQPHEGAWSDDDAAFNQGISSGPYYPPPKPFPVPEDEAEEEEDETLSARAVTFDPDRVPDDTDPAFGWELPTDPSADPDLGQGAADVADVPTPGDALDGSYPQPSTTPANTESVNSELDDALEVEADEEVEDKEPKTSSRRHGFTPSHHLMMPGPGGVLRYVECSPIGGLGDGEFVTCLLEDGSRVKAYAGHLSPIYANKDAARSDYEHWNEEADVVWWAEEGSQPESEPDPDEFYEEPDAGAYDEEEEEITDPWVQDRGYHSHDARKQAQWAIVIDPDIGEIASVPGGFASQEEAEEYLENWDFGPAAYVDTLEEAEHLNRERGHAAIDLYAKNLHRVGEWYDDVDEGDSDDKKDESEDKGDSDESEDSDEGSDDSDGDAPVESDESAPEEEKEDSGEEESTDEPSDDEKKEAFRATVQANLRMERR